MQRITLAPAFVLHTRPYSNSSLIVELFTKEYGRISVLAQSARGPKSRYQGKLQLFTYLLASWSGRHELKYLNAAEIQGIAYQLQNAALWCAFYINELLMRFLNKEDAYPEIFFMYQKTLQDLQQAHLLQAALRRFEKQLLESLGYGFSFEGIEEDAWYAYVSQLGFVRQAAVKENTSVFSGKSLLALKREDFSNETFLAEMKYLMRLVIQEHLGHQTLKSRELLL